MEYREALKDSPFWVEEAYREYMKLSHSERTHTPFLYFLLGGKGTPPFKQSKERSKYHEPSKVKGENCGNCAFYYVQPLRGESICSKIRGRVRKDGWCIHWHK